MNNVNYYNRNEESTIKGRVKLGDDYFAAELFISEKLISVRIFSSNKTIFIPRKNSYEFNPILFTTLFNRDNYILFGVRYVNYYETVVSSDNIFRDVSLSSQGFLYSRYEINEKTLFTSLSIYGENIKKWSGLTNKLYEMIDSHIHMDMENIGNTSSFLIKIQDIGCIELGYTYISGGINGNFSFGINIEPCVTISFEEPVGFDSLIKHYTDLYMLLRFFIGDRLLISDVRFEVLSHSIHDGQTQIFLPEKSDGKRDIERGMLLPFSTIYRDNSEYEFPHLVWESYYKNNNNIKELIKKYVTYSMVGNNEERFLGFYRMIETMTKEDSFFIEEEKLRAFLKRASSFLKKKFPEISVSRFSRAIMQANKNRKNTENHIISFVTRLPQTAIIKMNIEKINVNKICTSRNKIIHQPLYVEDATNVYIFMNETELLTKISLLIRLGISYDKLEEISDGGDGLHIFY